MNIIEKPWGKEEILETNPKYTVKRLTMNNGHRCSLQYHEKKMETIYVLSGILTVILNNQEYTMSEGIQFTIQQGEIHRMQAKNGDAIYLECSTSELDDVIRVEDDYFRGEEFKD
jgi:mannose-6-phosphate isomerase-like protein (cupin superfamily)